jgi:protein phosphatase
MTSSTDPLFEIGFASDKGRKRGDAPNQDSLIVLPAPKGKNLPPFFIVADGMGGYTGGELASQTIIDTFTSAYSFLDNHLDFQGFCAETLSMAHQKMQKMAESDAQLSSMGSTIVAASIDGKTLNIMNVGDSRAYLFHGVEIIQVNHDHSFVGEAVRAGVLTIAEAMTHPKKNQLTQSVSARRTEITPFFNQVPFDEDDVLVLCSDGLWGVVSESIIQAVVMELSVQIAAEKLVKLANSRGGPDNISVIVCKKVGSKSTRPIAEAD